MYKEQLKSKLTWPDTDDHLDKMMSDGYTLSLAASALIEHVANLREGQKLHSVTAIGGPAVGADALAHAVSVLSGLAGGEANLKWFSVYDGYVFGAELTSEDYVILVEDWVCSGKALADAYKAVVDTGATVEFITPLLDSGESAADLFDARAYFPVFMREDLTD